MKIPVNPIDGHIEGKYIEVLTKPILDNITGIHKDNAYAGTRESYYIPFNKRNVDSIIANSAHSDKDSIRFVVKFGNQDSTDFIVQSMRMQFSYNMFLWDWERLREWEYWPIDDIANRPNPKKSATTLAFKPQ